MKETPVAVQLAPLIISVVLIIIVTLVIGGARFQSETEEVSGTSSVKMRLSPIQLQRSKTVRVPMNAPIELPKVEYVLSAAGNDMDHQNYDKAEDKLRTALVFYPKNHQLLSMLGSVLYKQKKYQEAEWVFRKLTELNPDDATAYNNLGAALASQNRFKEAIANVEKVYHKNEASAVTALNLSSMHSLAGNTAEAIEYFKKAYNEMGVQILPLTYSSNFDNIRKEKAFIEIVREAKEKQESVKK